MQLMKEGAAAPRRLVDINPLPCTEIDARRARPAARGAGAHERRRRRPRRARALSGDRAGAAGERVRPGAQHGLDRRQPAAAHPLHLLPRPGHALQQARSGQRLAARSRAITACTRSSAAASAASPRTPRISRSLWSRSTPWSWWRGRRRAADPDRGVPPAARRYAGARHRARAGRADPRGRGAGERRGAPVALSQDPGSGLVRVRARVGGGGPGGGRRRHPRGAARGRRRRHQALAPAQRRRRRWSGARRRPRRTRRRRIAPWRAQARCS